MGTRLRRKKTRLEKQAAKYRNRERVRVQKKREELAKLAEMESQQEIAANSWTKERPQLRGSCLGSLRK